MLEFDAVCAGYAGMPVVRDVTLTCMPGTVTGIIGKNGCGKSTLLRTASGQLRPLSGRILAEGEPIAGLSPRILARRIALLPQVRNVPVITAGALVMHGRFPYLSFPRIPTDRDRQIVRDALRTMGAEAFSDTELPRLSGGERQRVYLAMLLAQQSPVLLLDEPATYLDLAHQFEVLDLLKTLRQAGKTVVVVMHDLAHAVSLCDRLVLLHEGAVVFTGSGEELCESGLLPAAMGVEPHRARDARSGQPVYYFTPCARGAEQ